MPNDPSATDRSTLRAQALSRWINEGGTPPAADPLLGTVDAAVPPDRTGTVCADGPPQSNAEIVQLKVRVIALENLVMALLADASPRQRTLASEMANTISPRAGATPHRLTVQAAGQMRWLAERAQILREQAEKAAPLAPQD